jgi:uncharacterized membrane protein
MTSNVVLNVFLLCVIFGALALMFLNRGTSSARLSYVMGIVILAMVAMTVITVNHEDNNDPMFRALQAAKAKQK